MTQTQEHNVPTLRFSEFSREWNSLTLGDIATFSKGKGISKADIAENGVIECIRYGQLYTDYGETIGEIKSRTNVPANELVLSEANDIIIPASGETQIDIATASCVLRDGVALGGDLNIVKTSNNGVFLSYYLNSKRKIDIARLSQGISVVHLYAAQLKTLHLNLPEASEQKKISAFLSSVDRRIVLLGQKKALLQRYKKGMMQKLFSQKLRFKDAKGHKFPDWEEKRLGEILKESRIRGSTGETAKKITVKLWGRGVFYKDTKGSPNTQYYKRKGGQFIYSKLDFLNSAFGVIPVELDGFESTVDLPCFDVLHGNSAMFLLDRISQKNFYKRLGDIADGSRKAKRIHADTFLDFNLVLPSPPEQQKIADFLSSIDRKIDLVSTELDYAKTFKKGLLQQMFI